MPFWLPRALDDHRPNPLGAAFHGCGLDISTEHSVAVLWWSERTEESILERQGNDERRAERMSHALYGLIIVTATLVTEQQHIADPLDALGLLLGTALVLLLAHTYSAYMAEKAISGSLGAAARRLVVIDNVPVVGSIVVPSIMFTLAWAELVSMRAAYFVSIAFTLLALFGLGVYEGRIAGFKTVHAVASGLVAAAVGILVIFVESFFD
jgi:hypothetical protein